MQNEVFYYINPNYKRRSNDAVIFGISMLAIVTAIMIFGWAVDNYSVEHFMQPRSFDALSSLHISPVSIFTV